MWKCDKCQESVEDSYDTCWNCGTSREGIVDPTFQRVETQAPAQKREEDVTDPISCPRCEQQLDFVGTRRLHEGTNWGVFGELGELFVKRERFDVYVCSRCGRGGVLRGRHRRGVSAALSYAASGRVRDQSTAPITVVAAKPTIVTAVTAV